MPPIHASRPICKYSPIFTFMQIRGKKKSCTTGFNFIPISTEEYFIPVLVKDMGKNTQFELKSSVICYFNPFNNGLKLNPSPSPPCCLELTLATELHETRLFLFFLPGVLKFNKRERWSSSSVFQVDITDRPVLVKDILDVFGANVGRQVAHVNPTVVVSRRTSDHSTARHILPQTNKLLRTVHFEIKPEKSL